MKLFKKILVPVLRASPSMLPIKAHTEVNIAIDMAKANNASLTFIAFEEDISPIGDSWVITCEQLKKLRVQDCQVILDACVAYANESGVKASSDLEWCTPIHGIISTTARESYDLIVKVPHKWHFLGMERLSGDDMNLLRRSQAPVWLTGHESVPKPALEKVLVSIDVHAYDQNLNNNLLKTAHQIARNAGAELHVLHCWKLVGEEYAILSLGHVPAHMVANAEKTVEAENRKYLKALMAEAGIPDTEPDTYLHFMHGRASHEICQLAAQLPADLLVLGTHARRGLERWLMGNTAENVVSGASCSLLVVRTPQE